MPFAPLMHITPGPPIQVSYLSDWPRREMLLLAFCHTAVRFSVWPGSCFAWYIPNYFSTLHRMVAVVLRWWDCIPVGWVISDTGVFILLTGVFRIKGWSSKLLLSAKRFLNKFWSLWVQKTLTRSSASRIANPCGQEAENRGCIPSVNIHQHNELRSS